MTKLTKRLVENAPTKEKPYFLFDQQLNGFCVRISPNGKQYYYLQYRHDKKVKRWPLGMHGPLTTEAARNLALKTLADIKNGHDPFQKKEESEQKKIEAKREPDIAELAERFIKEHASVHCKESTKKGYQRYLDKHILPFFEGVKVSAIERKHIAEFHHSLRDTPTEANRSLEVISKMLSLAELWGLRPDASNPCRHIKKYAMTKRERYLTKKEAARLGHVLEDFKTYPDENHAAAFCIQLLMLTGCRLGEIQTLKWDYIDEEAGLFRLPDSKTGAKCVYVSNAVLDLLDEIRKHPTCPTGNPYVIWGRNEGTYLKEMQKPWRRIRSAAKLTDVRIHDLRHSFASFAVSNGMSLAMIGKLLGHSQVQTTARYAHLMADPMREAADRVTDELGKIIKLPTARKKKQKRSEVVTIPGTDIRRPTYLTAAQAAEYLDVPYRLLENWRWRKIGPTYQKVGNRIRYRKSELDRFLGECGDANPNPDQETSGSIHLLPAAEKRAAKR